MAIEVAKVLYIVVVSDENEKKEESGKESFRYTRPILQSTLQLMGCKARHAFKASMLVADIRKRKSLKQQMTPLSEFEDNIEAEFVELLAIKQSHKSFFGKSDLLFVCMLRPLSFDIQKQDSEIEAAQWMPFEEYAAQPFMLKHEQYNYITKVCSAKKDNGYTQFSAVPTTTSSGYIYFLRKLKKVKKSNGQMLAIKEDAPEFWIKSNHSSANDFF